MQCGSCGEQVQLSAEKCTSCGADLLAAPPSAWRGSVLAAAVCLALSGGGYRVFSGYEAQGAPEHWKRSTMIIYGTYRALGKWPAVGLLCVAAGAFSVKASLEYREDK